MNRYLLASLLVVVAACLLACPAHARELRGFDWQSFVSGASQPVSYDRWSDKSSTASSDSDWFSSWSKTSRTDTSKSIDTSAWQDRLKQAADKWWPRREQDTSDTQQGSPDNTGSSGGNTGSSGPADGNTGSSDSGPADDHQDATAPSGGNDNAPSSGNNEAPSQNQGSGGDGVSDTVMKGVLDLHNSYRARHGVPALSWSSSVAATAQSHSSRCVFQHSKGSGYGENIGQGYKSFDDVVRAWYSEANGYSYNGGIDGAGHFTQIVWKSTTQLGCGVSPCGGKPFYVCNYSPPGNYGDRVKENVFPPRG